MKIGCLKEIKKYEYRVGLTPDNVNSYVAAGHDMYIESGAGEGSGYSDEQYSKAGATIISDAKEVWDIAEMIVKVKEPLAEEFSLMREGQILFTYLHLAADRALTDCMLEKNITGFAYETLVLPNRSIPLLTPMSRIAGRLSLQEGAKYLEKPFGGSGILLSGVPGTPKAKVVVIGAGVVGENACRIAMGMGADVSCVDINLERLEQLDTLYGSGLQTIFSTPGNIEAALSEADLVIGSVLIPGKAAPKLIKREYLSKMKPGSVIVDVAIDQGGCAESSHVTYHDDPVFIEEGIVHYCVGNMPGAVPRTSTVALTNATLRYGLMIANFGVADACKRDPNMYTGVNTYAGKLTCKNVADSYGLEFIDPATLL